MEEFRFTTISQEEPIINISEEINKLLADYGDTHLYVIHALYISDRSPYYYIDMTANLNILLGYHYEDTEEDHDDLTSEVLDLKEFLTNRQGELKRHNLNLDDARYQILGPNRIQVILSYSAHSSSKSF